MSPVRISLEKISRTIVCPQLNVCGTRDMVMDVCASLFTQGREEIEIGLPLVVSILNVSESVVMGFLFYPHLTYKI